MAEDVANTGVALAPYSVPESPTLRGALSIFAVSPVSSYSAISGIVSAFGAPFASSVPLSGRSIDLSIPDRTSSMVSIT